MSDEPNERLEQPNDRPHDIEMVSTGMLLAIAVLVGIVVVVLLALVLAIR